MNFFRKFKFEIIISLIFIILATVVTFPLIFNLRSQVYDYKGDLLEALWYAWWVKYAWQHNLSPQFVPIIASPFGIDLSQDITKNISLSFANYPLLILTILVDEIFAYNFIILLTFPFAGLTMYFLAYYFTKNKWASFFSGLAFAFCPYHFAHASHITLANIQWMPLFVLFLFKLHNERTFTNATLCGLFFALTLLSDTYYGYFMLVLTATFVIFKLFQKLFNRKSATSRGFPWLRPRLETKSRTEASAPRRASRDEMIRFTPRVGFLKNSLLLLMAIFVAALVSFPYVSPILKSYIFKNETTFSLQRYTRDIGELYKYSAKLPNYILPASNHPVFGSFTQSLKESIFYGDLQEGSLYLGLITIFLAIFGYRFWKNREKLQIQNVIEKEQIDFSIKFFAVLAVVAFLFSLSPKFMIFGTYIKLPSYYVFQIFPFFRAIARFGIVVMLSLSILAGFGFKFLIERQRNFWKKIAVGCVLVLILLFEFANIPPFRTTEIGKAPKVYQWLKSQEGEFLVVEYPMEEDDTIEYFFNQRIHQKKLVNGALPKTEAYSVKEKIVDILKPGTTKILKELGVKYVILHLSRYNEKSERNDILKELNNFDKKYGLILVEDFGDTKVFKLRKKL
jgi:hypothetical protein